MTVHMFRCVIGRGKMSVVDIETRIDDWVNSNAEWEDDTQPHTLHEKSDGVETTYYKIDVRFLKQDTKDNLLQKFTDKLVNKTDWYRVGYHDCTHDETPPQDCDWDDNAEWTAKDVTIPSHIPKFEVNPE